MEDHKGCRSSNDGKRWKCRCGTVNYPTTHLIFNLPAFQCRNCANKLALDFKFCLGDVEIGGKSLLGEVLDQGKEPTCVPFAYCKAIEILERRIHITNGTDPDTVMRIDPVGLEIRYAEKFPEVCWGDSEFTKNLGIHKVLHMGLILRTEGIERIMSTELGEQGEPCKVTDVSTIPFDSFEEICQTLAEGIPLVATYLAGKRRGKLPYCKIYKSPSKASIKAKNAKEIGHAVVLIGAGMKNGKKYFYFLNSWGKKFCPRKNKKGEVISGGVGKLRPEDLTKNLIKLCLEGEKGGERRLQDQSEFKISKINYILMTAKEKQCSAEKLQDLRKTADSIYVPADEVDDGIFRDDEGGSPMVGMKPLERSLEKLDDVRKKELSDMIGSASDTVSSSGTAPTSNTGGATSARGATDSLSMKRSAASTLSGKKPIQAVATTMKSGPAKSTGAKKADSVAQSKASAAAEIEDVEERLKLTTVHDGFSDSVKVAGVSMSLPSKAALKSSKHGANDHVFNMSKAVSQRGLPARTSVTMTSTHYPVQSQALVNIKDSNKKERERCVFVRKFKFEEPRREQIDELKIDLFKHFREDVSLRLWNLDFKRQIDGIELLQKVLDFLPELFDVLKDQSYMLTEAEAAIFLPCLIEKSGHNIEKVREKMGDLIKQMVNIYSLPKLLPYILEGLRSKNNRTRIECVDIIGCFIDHHGTEVSGLMKNLPSVAALTAERDGEIRKAALNTLATAYKNLGDDVWRYVGKLSDAQRSMLDDRFKWKAREMDKRREGRPGDARAALRRSVRENGSDIAEQSGEVVSRSVAGSMISRDNFGYNDGHIERHLVPRQMAAAATGPADWHEALDIISLGLPEQSVEGMKVICHELTQAADPESTVLEELIKEADRLVSCLAVMVPKTFNFSLSGASSRSCKYVLNTLMQTFQIKRLAHAVKEATLDNLITELLLWLLDERVPLMDDGSQLLKALNVLMLKILDNAERTSSFAVLINLLRPLDPSRWPSPSPTESLAVKNQKFSDLVVKCLIKLTKVLQSTIYEVDLDRILQSIHIYLQELGMEEIRRRAGADDKPLRMVKTVLHELVKLRGTAIKGHLSMVPIDAEPQPIILAYIDLNLQTLAAARMLTPSGPMGQTQWGDAASNNPNTSTHSADAQLKQELAAVFKKIGDKQTCTIGLYELYRITQLYPKVDIFAQLQNASEAFRTYIRDGLAQVEKNAAAGRTPSSLPLSTPPPIASIASPKFAPSPVHTKSINSKTDCNEDDSSCEAQPYGGHGEPDTRLNSIDQQTDRFQASGTLDALRERMKSIQAAAVGHFDGAQGRPLTSMNGNTFHGGPRLDSEPQHQSNIPPMDERALSGLQARMERLKSGSMEPL